MPRNNSNKDLGILHKSDKILSPCSTKLLFCISIKSSFNNNLLILAF